MGYIVEILAVEGLFMYSYDTHWDRLPEVFLDLLEICLSFHVELDVIGEPSDVAEFTRSRVENIASCRTDQYLRKSNLGGLKESLTIPLRTSLRNCICSRSASRQTACWPTDGGSRSGWTTDGGI